ncbi:UNKNOWN [Stylonychia lemnae]|uniref:Uncharacterized protein n=1 Tax=Stylonychia lemnae TaxID=5949 RepID=A0A077ZRS0_STYLE|nr:UNKNOWN [Stylonychia lemnae]|eukprot:CDW72040.1 UNKNOWN [Stylonychia lemnae]
MLLPCRYPLLGVMDHFIQTVGSSMLYPILLNKIKNVVREKRVVPEDYFRVLKEKKEVEQNNKTSKQKLFTGGIGISGVEGISQIDPEMEDEEAIKYIELPQETLYLIDKVVRSRAKTGPIGVDNSELINIELEQDFRNKNQYIENLVNGGKKQGNQIHQSTTNQEDKENIDNQKLLDRLTTAAAKTTNNLNNRSKMSAANSQQKSVIGEKSAMAVSHEEWMRRKQHEVQLKEQLIIEAKKDMLEQLRRKQAEEQLKREEKELALMQWEERKRQEEDLKKQEQMLKERDEKLHKQRKQIASYQCFKEWLKQSLIKQREEMLKKKIEDQQKKELEEREKKAKANMKVMAKIAYKEWKEKKADENRQQRKKDKLERRNRLINGEVDGDYPGGNHKKGEVMLAYGLNKNLKKIRERPKSAKPSKKNKNKKKEIHFS